MSHDPERRRFFAYLNLFVAAMLLLVLADNYLGLYMGWRAWVGVLPADRLLVPASRARRPPPRRPSSSTASATSAWRWRWMVLFATVGTVTFANVFSAAPAMSQGSLNAVGLMLLLAACGKSAQVPLQSWLGDAMEGPTPVSALIHAATMVTAGVYLIVRSGPIFDLAPTAQTAVVVVGAGHVVVRGDHRLRQGRHQEGTAASTMSQIGYMVLAAGLGSAGYAGGDHASADHGFFKAGLFLGAGSVMHAMNDETDMRATERCAPFCP